MAARGRGSAARLVAGAAFLCVAVLLAAVTPAAEAGTTYFVGDAAGWTHKVDYGQWAAGKTFCAGDILGMYTCRITSPLAALHVLHYADR